jgi:hypothetical protein
MKGFMRLRPSLSPAGFDAGKTSHSDQLHASMQSTFDSATKIKRWTTHSAYGEGDKEDESDFDQRVSKHDPYLCKIRN